jgi:hypothetical protein
MRYVNDKIWSEPACINANTGQCRPKPGKRSRRDNVDWASIKMRNFGFTHKHHRLPECVGERGMNRERSARANLTARKADLSHTVDVTALKLKEPIDLAKAPRVLSTPELARRIANGKQAIPFDAA